VFTPVYSTFIQRAYDQVNHDVARQNLHVVFGIDRAGLVGADGETHQGIYDIALLRHIPNMTILHPKDANEAYTLLNTAFKVCNGPVALRYPRGKTICDFNQTITSDTTDLKWDILHDGETATFIGFGTIVTQVLEYVKTHQLDIKVINAKVIKPLDQSILNQIALEHRHTVVYEEAALAGGFGSSILEFLNQHNQSTNHITLMGIEDAFIQHGDTPSVLRELKLDLQSVINTLMKKNT
jgi:1-deoxy-D-xylulose-5-phosphate synthase